MSEQKEKHGKREASRPQEGLGKYWAQYKSWLAGMTRGQRIRYRLLQAATIVAIIIIAAYLALSAWIRVPDLPGPVVTPPGPGTQTGSGMGSGSSSSDPTFEGAEMPHISLSGRKDGKYTFLLAGQDVVSGSTDVVLLLTYDINEKTIQGLSLPRDTMVNVSSRSKRLNSVFNNNRGRDKETWVENGMAGLKKAVDDLTGITPDYYVLVQWDAVGELVEAVDGVEFTVPFDMDYDDPAQDLHIHQKAGTRVLRGDDAMQVVRWRKNNDGSHSSGGDLTRLGIQQDFLKAVAKKCLQPATLLKIPDLARIFTENVDTDLTVGYILGFAQEAIGMDPDTGVTFQTAPIASGVMYGGASMVTLDGKGILEIVNSGMNPYQRDVEAGDLSLIYHKKDGSFGVTTGTLADAAMGQVPVSKPKDDEEPDDGDTSADPNTGDVSTAPGTGDSSTEPGGSDGDTSTAPGTGDVSTDPGTGDTSTEPAAGGTGEGGGTGPLVPSEGNAGPLIPSDVFPDPSEVLPDPGETGEAA